jgi:hypothetical protein
LMKRIPLHIKKEVILVKLLHIIVLTLSGLFLELSLELFFFLVTSGGLWAKNRSRNVCNATVRIAIIVVAWPFMCHSECGGRDVASSIMRIIVIAVNWPFTCHSNCWGRIVSNGVIWIVVIAMAWPFMCRTECWGRVIANGVVWIVVIATAWTFVWSIECRSTRTDVV